MHTPVLVARIEEQILPVLSPGRCACFINLLMLSGGFQFAGVVRRSAFLPVFFTLSAAVMPLLIRLVLLSTTIAHSYSSNGHHHLICHIT